MYFSSKLQKWGLGGPYSFLTRYLLFSGMTDCTIKYSTVQYSTVQYHTVQYSTVHWDDWLNLLTWSVRSDFSTARSDCSTASCLRVTWDSDVTNMTDSTVQYRIVQYNQWTRTEVSCSPPRNPLWRALASKLLNQLSSVTPFYKWEAMSFHHILSDLVSDFGKGPKRGFKKKLNLFSELAKSLHPTLESSSIQTTEQIVKCHTILEMGSHDLSPHTFRSGLQFFKGLQKGV